MVVNEQFKGQKSKVGYPVFMIFKFLLRARICILDKIT